MINHRKKKAFTVVELLIVMTLTGTVLGIVWTMFNMSNKTISDVTIKSDLQSEGQVIQERLSNIMMQAIEIESIEGNTETGEITSMKIKSYGNDLSETEFIVEMKPLGETYKDGGQIQELSIGSKVVSNNVKSIRVGDKSIIGYSENDLKKVKSMELDIILKKENGYSKNIEYPVSIKSKFRNGGKG